ncbi:hypothetical protein ABTM95_19180, partial [Acinetobacter baumannii]
QLQFKAAAALATEPLDVENEAGMRMNEAETGYGRMKDSAMLRLFWLMDWVVLTGHGKFSYTLRTASYCETVTLLAFWLRVMLLPP